MGKCFFFPNYMYLDLLNLCASPQSLAVLIKVDKLLKEDCERNGDFCDFNRRFLNVLNRLPSLSDYNAWSLKKHGSTAQNVQMKLIKDAVKENFGESLIEMPKTTDEFLTRIEDYDFEMRNHSDQYWTTNKHTFRSHL